MLEIVVPGIELFDNKTQSFSYLEDQTLQLEHSLVSLSRWESKWHKAFLSKNQKTAEETLDYIKCMTLTQGVAPEVYERLTVSNLNQINEYIGDTMTATYISEDSRGKAGRETVTAELIYYWMIALNIPFECQYWHLNRLLTLVRVCNVKNQPPKKMGKGALMRRNAALNAARRKQLGSKG